METVVEGPAGAVETVVEEPGGAVVEATVVGAVVADSVSLAPEHATNATERIPTAAALASSRWNAPVHRAVGTR